MTLGNYNNTLKKIRKSNVLVIEDINQMKERVKERVLQRDE